MQVALEDQDLILVSPLAYGVKFFDSYPMWITPKRGDIVAFRTPYLQRENALAGVLEFLGRIFLFGKPLDLGTSSSRLEDSGYQLRRIVGLPGDYLEYRGGRWYVLPPGQTEVLEERQISARPYEAILGEELTSEAGPFGDDGWEIQLGEDEYFVAADDRRGYLDSRHYGTLSKKDLMGRVVLRYAPLDRFGRL